MSTLRFDLEGPLDVTTTGLGTTQTTSSGLALVNTTAAAAGLQQISPAVRWSGLGWKTDVTAASQAVDFRSYVVPVQGTANPTGYLSFGSSVNGAAYNDGQMVLTTTGNVGIGTAGPSSKLMVSSDQLTNLTVTVAKFFANSASSGSNEFQIRSRFDSSIAGRRTELQSLSTLGTVFADLILQPNGGNVGIGVIAPVVGLLHVSSETAATGLSFFTQVDSSADGFDQNFRKARGVGIAPAVITTADELGVINFTGYGGAAGYITGAAIKGISSGTIADSRVPGQLSFWTGTNALPSVLTERVTIDNAGNVGIGTAVPLAKFHVVGSGRFSDSTGTSVKIVGDGTEDTVALYLFNDDTASSEDGWYFISLPTTNDLILRNTTAGGSSDAMSFTKSSGNVGIGTTVPGTHRLHVVGTAGLTTGTAWTNTSDRRWKNVQAELKGRSLDKILTLRPVSYTWNDLHDRQFGENPGRKHGFIAQEVEKVLPELISKDSAGFYWYNPSGMEAILTAAVQEQQEIISAQRRDLDELKARLAKIEERLNAGQ